MYKIPNRNNYICTECNKLKLEYKALQEEKDELAKKGLKECIKCGKIKKLEDFQIDNNLKNGRRGKCKVCRSVKSWEISHREYLKDKGFKKCNNCSTVKSLNSFAYYKGYPTSYCKICNRRVKRERAAIKRAERPITLQEHQQKLAKVGLKYCKQCNTIKKFDLFYKHTSSGRESMCKRCKLDYRNTIRQAIDKKIGNTMSSGMNNSLKGNKNGYHWETLIGYTCEDLMKHLESKFKKGMTWNNYGPKGWHIDHIRPKSWFNYTSIKDKEFKKCWSLDNLQPLWAKENLKKNNKYEG